MKIKNIAASVITVASLALVTLGSTSVVQAASVSYESTSGVIYVNNNNGAAVYTTPNANGNVGDTGNRLANNTAWAISKTVNIDGEVYYAVGKNQWINSSDITTTAPTTSIDKMMYVSASGNVNLYSSANGGYFTGNTVAGGSGYTVYAQTTDASGQVWYDLGGSQWINGKYMSDDNVKETVTMNATAYDPAVLGSNMGYSGVAANLSKYPKGTHLRITASNGTVYDRVVNDTGLFAYSNPNQLDIAMPNSQALSFGRQNVTVEVLG